MKRHTIIGIILFIAIAAVSGFYYYQHPTTDKTLAVDCDYFRRVADVHWAETKMYDDLAFDAQSHGDLSNKNFLDGRQFQKQTVAEHWEALYQDCKSSK
jgi:hypothetical protein